jgi:membrane-associated phospholipid phosphatase
VAGAVIAWGCAAAGTAAAQPTPAVTSAPPSTAAPAPAPPSAAVPTGVTPSSANATTGTAPQREALGTSGKPRDDFVWRYPTFRTSEYVATGIFAGMGVAGLVIPTATPRWRGPTGVDRPFRDGLRLDGRESRKTADDISDITLTLTLNYAAFDGTVVAWALRDKGSVAYQMMAINVEVLALTAGISSLSKAIIARERPYADECRTDPVLRRADDCEPDSVNVSFISGHSSMAFAAASVTCMHHAYLGLYASPGADTAACLGAYGAAAATGVLRIMSDNHYATDVASGAAVGTLVGLGLPWLLHYRSPVGDDDAATGPMDDVSFTIVPGPTSASVVGVF